MSENKAKGYQGFNSYYARHGFHSFGYLVSTNPALCLGNTTFKNTLLLTEKGGIVSTARN